MKVRKGIISGLDMLGKGKNNTFCSGYKLKKKKCFSDITFTESRKQV